MAGLLGLSCLNLNCAGSCRCAGKPRMEGDMAAYVVVEHTILNPIKFEECRTKVGPMIEKHGGRYITKGSGHKLLEVSRRPPDRVVIIKFPSMDAWYSSPEYQPLIALR